VTPLCKLMRHMLASQLNLPKVVLQSQLTQFNRKTEVEVDLNQDFHTWIRNLSKEITAQPIQNRIDPKDKRKISTSISQDHKLAKELCLRS
jgi:hypothetical protein